MTEFVKWQWQLEQDRICVLCQLGISILENQVVSNSCISRGVMRVSLWLQCGESVSSEAEEMIKKINANGMPVFVLCNRSPQRLFVPYTKDGTIRRLFFYDL
jgi:hypothetical protein